MSVTTADFDGLPADEPRRPIAAPVGAAALLVALTVGTASALGALPAGLARPVLTLTALVGAAAGLALLGARPRRRVVAVAASLAAALLVAEAALRVAAASYLEPVYRTNDDWLFEYRPGARRTNVFRSGKGPEHIDFAVNSLGFRGPEPRARGTARRVLVYGDSFIAAANTPFDETYGERLRAALLPAVGGEVEVINAGVTGTGPDQACRRLASDVARLAPDLVIVSVLAQNDYGDLVRNRLYDVGPRGELVTLRPQMPAEMRESFDPSPFLVVRAAESLASQYEAATFTPLPADALRRVYLDACRDEHLRAEAGDATVMQPFWDHPDTDVRLDPSSASARHKIALMERVLQRIRDVAADHGVPLAFLVIPAANDVCPGYDDVPVDVAAHPDFRADNRTAPIERVAAALGVPCVSLFAEFGAAPDPNALYLHGGDTHWNAAGQALAAEATARRIASLRLLR